VKALSIGRHHNSGRVTDQGPTARPMAFLPSHRTCSPVAPTGFAAEPAPAAAPAEGRWRRRQPSDHDASPPPNCGTVSRGEGTPKLFDSSVDILGFEALLNVYADRLPHLVDRSIERKKVYSVTWKPSRPHPPRPLDSRDDFQVNSSSTRIREPSIMDSRDRPAGFWPSAAYTFWAAWSGGGRGTTNLIMTRSRRIGGSFLGASVFRLSS